MAQGKVNSQWNCGKPTIAHSIDVGDHPGHAYAISQASCTASKGEIEGVKEKEGLNTEFDDVREDAVRFHGEFIDSLANGDKVVATYSGTGTPEKGQMQSTSKWSLASGTGKLKGIKGEGTCKGKSNPDGSSTFECTGEYTLAK
jgi:hypothetical protein